MIRPRSVPTEGVVPAFDAGWNAHEVGLSLSTVLTFAPASGRGWAVLGWKAREAVAKGPGPVDAPDSHHDAQGGIA